MAALLGLPGTKRTTYEGQAAVELELAAEGPTRERYPFTLRSEDESWVVETGEIVAGVAEEALAGRATREIAARFHRTMAEVVAAGCEKVREQSGTWAVALSGGTFQNMLVLMQTVTLLEERGFVVYRHRRVPTNDGGIALGQAVLANWALAA